ncbi:hypothetical protein NA2_19463 [Nitratireductor pacificus pht-3B]|uniref:Uncharacterized protein n=1 Tax=Nitratireductor pacificus pht-3B TaxID=391937 RepID=K2M4U5_9HYPH|nr:hypothetical protein NA2_19463 [Nitratireductor pacificus pht-3B]
MLSSTLVVAPTARWTPLSLSGQAARHVPALPSTALDAILCHGADEIKRSGIRSAFLHLML